jgi:hypothetical protein
MTRVLLVALMMSGCTYTVTVTSDVPGARVEGVRTGQSALPVDVKVPWGPLVHRRITVTAPDYRVVALDLGTRTVRSADFSLFNFFLPWRAPSEELNVVLVRDHGPAGTWTPADLGLE